MAEYLGDPRRRFRWGTVLTLLALLLAGWWLFAEVLDESSDQALLNVSSGPVATGPEQVLTQGGAVEGTSPAQGDNILHSEDTVGELVSGTDDGETQHLTSADGAAAGNADGAATGQGEPEEQDLAKAGADRSTPTSRATSGATLARALSQPQGHFGKSVSGTAVVTRVDSDRGFWVRSGNGDTYAMLTEGIDEPESETRILAGQELRLTGTVHPAAQLGDAGRAGKAPAYLKVTEVQVLEEAAER